MIYGLYLSAQGAQIQSTRQDVIANNLANASTNSFKRDLVRVQSHSTFDKEQGKIESLAGSLENLPGGVTPEGTTTDFSVGDLIKTKSPLDVAIAGKGFFQVTDGKRNFLTRDGQFSLTPNGQLVTREHGYALLAEGGQPMSGLDPAKSIEINQDGSVRQEGEEAGKLAVVEPASYQEIEKIGSNMYAAIGKLDPAKPGVEVRQGYLEASGTRPVTEMMELIEASRAFEANVNMIKHQDDALGRLLATLPKR